MSEEWRQVVGFPSYSISSLGRIRGPRASIMKPFASRYMQVTLYQSGKRKLAHVHRLVCEAFHGVPPSDAHEVAHADGDAHNNAASNLRWATRVENEADKADHGTSLKGRPSFVPKENRARGSTHGRATKPWRTARGERAGRAKLTERKVREIRGDGRPRKEIAAEHQVSVAMIGMIKTGKAWSHLN